MGKESNMFLGKKYNFKRILMIVLALVVYMGVVFVINKDGTFSNTSKKGNDGDEKKTTYEVARVIEIIKDNTTIDTKSDNIKKGSVEMKIEILSGKYKGKEYTITNYLSAMYNVDVTKGDKISVRIDKRADDGVDVAVYNYYRGNTIWIVVLLFAVILVIIGGKKGFRAIIGVLFTLINIVYILLPLSLKGYSVIGVTLAIILISTIVSFILLDGISKKTIISTVGTFCGILMGTMFALLATHILNVTTYQMDEAESLILAMSNTKLQPRNLLLCGIMISCMGAVMDVAMSIASAVEELLMVNEKLTIKELYKSGMNIGRDAMGTMANTLVLAFAGNSLNMLVLICSYGVSYIQLINTDFIALEIIKALSGSIGIIVAVPIVAFISSYIGKNVKISESKIE